MQKVVELLNILSYKLVLCQSLDSCQVRVTIKYPPDKSGVHVPKASGVELRVNCLLSDQDLCSKAPCYLCNS